ncbi:MAG: PAS domain-containing protein [Gemmatimonadetes bacterium]|nr:PAS domain-containing protein [Gemmatimonadota bacterium]
MPRSDQQPTVPPVSEGAPAPDPSGVAYRRGTDLDGRLQTPSPGIAAITGHAPGDGVGHLGTSFTSIVHPDDRRRLREGVTVAVRAGRAYEVAYRLRAEDGGDRWVLDRGREASDGSLEGVLLDLTSPLEEPLLSVLRRRREGEERFRQIAEHIDDVFWIGSPTGPERTYVSPAYRVIWGREPRRLRRDPSAWLAAVHPDDRDRVEDVVRRRAARGYEIQYRILHPDDTLRWIWDRAFPVLNPEGGVARVVGVAEDVTQRRKLEAQLRAAHRMEAVGRLAGGIAHDFNNLLTVIRGQSDLLLMDLVPDDPMVEEVEVVRDAADRAATLTRQLLAFSREQVLRPRVVDLVDVVRTMEQLLRRLLGEHIRIETDFEESLPPVRVDPAQLEQVIMNLAVNARDAMPDGGELAISARRERITPAVAGGRTELPVGTEVVRLDVRDDGHGMDEAVRARIFEPFFTTKRATGGTGLGLAMAYGIVKQSGGTIHVDSALGQGTTFELRFPPAWGERPEEPTDDPLPPPKGRVTGTILVVEDDPAVRRVADRTLQREGWDVRLAADAEQGLALLDEEGGRISVLLTDLVLPGMSGRDLIDRARERHPVVRCIAMSGYAEGSPERRIDLPPEVVFLPKPFTMEGLHRALDASADFGARHRRLPPEAV